MLREGRKAVITVIDYYSAAFDAESQIFLDGALADAGVSAKVRRIIHAVFAAATGIVRVRRPTGVNVMAEPFNIERGVCQGNIFYSVSRSSLARISSPGRTMLPTPGWQWAMETVRCSCPSLSTPTTLHLLMGTPHWPQRVSLHCRRFLEGRSHGNLRQKEQGHACSQDQACGRHCHECLSWRHLLNDMESQ